MLGAFLSLIAVAASVQKQFILPPFLRSQLFDVQFHDNGIPDPDKYTDSNIISLVFDGRDLLCAIPDALPGNESVEIQPLNDPELISNARLALSDLANVKYLSTDEDVWAWYVNFNSSIVQLLPSRSEETGDKEVLANNFHVTVGRVGDIEGMSISSAKPVVVNDKHMMMAVFTNGSMCDLTNAPRTARVFFTCDPAAEVHPRLRSVQEPYSCLYELVIGTSKLCEFPEFRDPQLTPNYIHCAFVEESE